MKDDLFGHGFITGCVFTWFVFLSISVHAEIKCQREHNVADCVMIEDPFVPYEAERAG